MDPLRQSTTQLTGLLLVLLTLAGCASRYREPALPKDQTALIEATAPAWIAAIDGKAVSQFGISGHKQFKISPGPHVVEVQYSQLNEPRYESQNGVLYTVHGQTDSARNISLQFSATAGKRYYVHDGRSGYSWRPSITESPKPTRPR